MELLKMNKKNKFFIEKTKSSLKHLGLVALIISLSVMFSSLCIMSLVSLSDSLYEAMHGNPKSQFGGEVKLYSPIKLVSDVKDELDEMKEGNIVKEYTYLSSVSKQYVLYLGKDYGKEYISVLGYEDESYPLKDVMNFQSGKDNMEELLTNKDGIVISEVLAQRNNIDIGDNVTLVSSNFLNNETFRVVDLIKKDYKGGIYSVFINKDRLREFEQPSTYMFYIDGNQEKISESFAIFEDQNITVETLDQFSQQTLERDRSFILFIRGLSILGLFIGSFGIASAIKVIINKRKRELGILKTIGFVGKDISKMLLMEVSVISIVGSLVGVILGYVFFYYLIDILSSADGINIILNTRFNLLASIISLIVSIVASILFAYISIKQISEIKPVYALKELPYTQTKKQKGKNILRFLIVAVIFIGISIFLAQSVIYGIGSVAIVSVGILIFSLIFRLVYYLILKIPIKTHNAIELSWRNLRLNYKKIIVSMVAIFTGVVAVNLINTLMYSSQKVYDDQYTEVKADINIVTDRANPMDNNVIETLNSLEEVNNYILLYKTPVSYSDKALYGDIVGVDISKMDKIYNVIEGEQKSYGVLISKNEQDFSEQNYQVGDSIKVNNINIPITGIYEIDYQSLYTTVASLSATNIVSLEEFEKSFSDSFVEEVWVSVDNENIDTVLSKISDIPDIFITSSKQYEEMLNSSINLLIKFATSIASLALLAGIILIITVTILDVVSRRRDFAIYKVIGFKQNEVSGMVLVEYGLMTLITSIFASGLVYLVTIFMNEYGSDLLDINQKIYFDFTGSVLWNLGLMALVLTLVYFVSKQTLKVKPADMLRYE
jgi:putative ABC transport system permease protein